ncbi:MAG: threonine-phosphate decarboxylase CobD [Steroidobacteraceae bacterium]
MLEHGGRLRRAAQRHGIALEQWVDLSTGVNPASWCGIDVPRSAWARLPEDEDGLLAAAQRYYAANHVLPVAGSQAAIMHLPGLRAPGRVGVLAPSYAEHALRWRQAGHQVTPLSLAECACAADDLDVLVLVNPNNPTGERIARARLLDWHTRLAARGGWLVIDEAFADADPTDSLAACTERGGLIVLRSLGKFFGLAGARVGFVLAEAQILGALEERLGPWTIAAPARLLAEHALADRAWQSAMREQLLAQSARLAALLRRCGLPPAGGCSLFQWVMSDAAATTHDVLARAGILTRLFETPSGLRFGLPAREAHWERLERALGAVRRLPP